MIEKILILCGGLGSRWGNFTGVPKQLINVSGEPLLHRTVRQFSKHGKVWIVGDGFSANGAIIHKPVPGDRNTDKFASSERLWGGGGNVLFVHGDVFFENTAVDKICGLCRDESLWFGNIAYYEILASFCAKSELLRWKSSMEAVLQMEGRGETAGGSWRMLRHWNGLPLEASTGEIYPFPNHPAPLDRYVDIPGKSRDFDYPADLVNWLTEVAAPEIAKL